MRRQIKLSPVELTTFCSQISLFMRSGLPLTESLELMLEGAAGGRLRAAIISANDIIAQRRGLSDAMRQTGLFPDYVIKMSEIGELSGNLEEVMGSLAHLYERESGIKERIRGCLTYTGALLIMMCAVVLLLVTQALPMFGELLAALGGQLPGFVTGLMAMGLFFVNNWVGLTIVIVTLVAAGLVYAGTSRGAYAIGAFKSGFPPVKWVYDKILAERFASALSFLLLGGVNIEQAVDLTREALGNPYVSTKIKKALAADKNVYDALYHTRVLPGQLTKMLSMGFRVGALDGVAERLAQEYGQQADKALNRVISVVEASAVALVSVVVGIILASVILPMISVMSFIGTM